MEDEQKTREQLLSEIRELKKFKQSHHTVTEVFDSITDAFFLLDADWRLTYVNRKTEELWHSKRKDLLGKLLWEVYPDRESETVCSLFEHAAKHGIPGNFEVYSPYLQTWIEYSVNPTASRGLTVLFRDIGDRKKAESQLRESEEKYRLLFEMMQEGFGIAELIYDEEGRNKDSILVESNSARAAFLGQTKEMAVGLRLSDLVAAPQSHFALCDNVIRTGIPARTEFYHPGRDRWLEMHIYPLPKQNQYAVFFIDITERIKSEQQVMESNQRFMDIINFLPDATFVIDQEGKVIAWNKAIEEMSGVFAEEILGQGDYAYALPFYGERRPGLIDWVRFDEQEIAELQMNIQRSRSQISGESFCPLIGEKGAFVYTTASPLYDSKGNLVGAIESIRNVTARKSAEEALRQSEEKFGKAFYSSPVMMTITRMKDRIHLAVNDTWLKTLGYDIDEVVGKDVLEGASFTVNMEDTYYLMRELEQNGYCHGFEIEVLTKRGEIRTCLSSWEIIVIDNEPCILGTAIDITDRKQSERALRQSEERFFKIFHNSPDMMAIIELDQITFTEVNKKFLDTLEYIYKDVVGRSPIELGMLEPIVQEKALHLLETEGQITNQEVSIRSKAGKLIRTVSSLELIELDGKTYVLLVSKDLTKEKKMEEDIARLDRLNLIGEMAASIGHEIRNPMTAVRGFLQLLQEENEREEYDAYYELMLEELDRANNIISEYLTMARDKAVELMPGYLDIIINKILPMIQAEALMYDKQVRVATDVVSQLLLDEKEIRQMIFNLARNGLEAMAPGGTLTLGAVENQKEVILYVNDEGGGFSKEALNKVGTPFFTTKNNGTGLGLAVCYSIANRHGAKIEIITDISGTRVLVSFPLYDNAE